MFSRVSLEEGDHLIDMPTEPSCDSWSDASWVLYLNLINYKSKTWGSWIPWGSIPSQEKDVLRFCKREIYSLYKSTALKLLATCPTEELPRRVRKLLRVYGVLGDTPDDGPGLYGALIGILTSRDDYRHDHDVLLDIWKRVCRSESAKIAVFEAAMSKETSRVLCYTLCAAREAGFDFWGAWSGHPSIRYCPVTDALLNGKLEHLTILLQNGFQQNAFRVHTYDKVFKAPINPTYQRLRAPLASHWTSKRHKILTEALLFLHLLKSIPSQRQRRALLHCHETLWATLPDATPSSAELGMPSPGLFEPRAHPRPLQHLCRCRVRAALGSGLPAAADRLPLPQRLRDYIADVKTT